MVYQAMMGAKARLRESSSWFPIPALIAFFLVMLLTTHIAVSTNPRSGQPASVLPLTAEPSEDSAIWFAIVIEGDEVVISDNYRKVFRWQKDVTSLESLRPFITHIKQRAATEIKAAALANKISSTQRKVLIAVDQNLKYSHFRPVLYALAEAGISDYGFETVSLQQDEIAHGPEHPEDADNM
jgi:biopolymer transport protein ExbD